MSLEIKYERTSDNLQINLIGEVDISTSLELKNKVIELIEENKDMVINCQSLDYIDSTGLGVLMGVYKRIQERNLKLKIINVKPNIYKLFDITGLNKVFNIQE